MLAHLLADVRYGIRGLLKRPLFSLVVVLTLAVGIGVNVAFYAIYDGMLVRPMPAAHAPDELVNLAAPGGASKQGSVSCDLTGTCEEVFSYPMFRDLQRVQQPFTDIAAQRIIAANVAYEGDALSGAGLLVSGSYFGVLGVQPALGRLLGAQDEIADGSADAVVLSHRYWQNALGGDPNVVGRALVVNGKPLTIVGVTESEFQGSIRPFTPDVFVPITFSWRATPGSIPNFEDRRNYWVYLFARLKPGVTAAQAEAAITSSYRALLADVEAPLQTGMSEQLLAQFRARQVTVTPGPRGQSEIMRGASAPLAILLVAAATVLAIACVNIANLMLARGATRVGEMAVRLSIGASPGRLVGLIATESTILALTAALASLPLTHVTLRWIETMVPAQGAASFDFGVNVGLSGVTVVVALLCVLTFALVPALKLARTSPGQALHSQGTRSTGSKATNRLRTTLVTAQIALSMMLLVLAGLFAQSLANVARVDLGIRTESLLSFSISPERNGYSSSATALLLERIEEQVAALPGVDSVASSLVTLLSGDAASRVVRVPGFEPSPGTLPLTHFNGVSPGYFDTLGVPLVDGRDFRAADSGLDQPPVAIVNQRFVEYFGLGASAVGTRIAVREGGPVDTEIVGVIRNAKYNNVKEPIRAQLFQPRGQIPNVGSATFYVRTAGEPETAIASIRDVVARLDSSLPIMTLQTVDRQVAENVFLDAFMGQLATALAVLATLLAIVGVYGALSYMVAQRMREIGLRIALGAPPDHIRGMVLRRVGTMVVVGGALGMSAAVGLGQAAGAVLYGVQAADPVVLLVAVAVLAAIVFGAGYLPARRAARIDPLIALRSE
jgi:putative ABC transport system permease protein